MNRRVDYRQQEFIDETAVAWFQRLHLNESAEGEAAEQLLEFENWFAESELHAAAYNAVCALWLETGAYREAALQQFWHQPQPGTNAENSIDSKQGLSWPFTSRFLQGVAATVAMIAILSLAWLTMQPGAKSEGYDTARAEVASINLDDGSTVHLNAKTQITATYTRDQRRLSLSRGEAVFVVASDKARPFTVEAGVGVVEAVGTKFDINRLDGKTLVTVLEGKVRISAKSDREWTVYAKAGEQISYDNSGYRRVVVTGSLQRFTAWRNGKFEFDGKPLHEVVIEFNRFGKIPIVIDKPELNDILISGSFEVDDAETFLRALEWMANVKVDRTTIPEYRVYGKK